MTEHDAESAAALDLLQMDYEPEVCDAMRRFVRPGDWVLDAGANIGFHTHLLSRLVQEGGVVLAFEPDAASMQILRANIVKYHMDNVVTYLQALWSRDCEMTFWSTPEVGYSSLQRYANATPSQVAVRSLDSLFQWMGAGGGHAPVPRLVKLDCEGSEGQILLGARALLSEGVDCVIAEFNFNIMDNFGMTERDIRGYMRDLGYDFYLLERGCKPLRLSWETQLRVAPGGPSTVMVNTMFARHERVAELWR